MSDREGKVMDLTEDQLYGINDWMADLLRSLSLLPKDADERDAILDYLVFELVDALDRAFSDE